MCYYLVNGVNYMELNSYDDLIMALQADRDTYNRILNDLDNLSINPFSRDRIKRKRLKRRLEILEDRIADYKGTIDEATTFKRYQLLSFMCEYLSLTEQEDIIVTKVSTVEEVESDSYSTGVTYMALGAALKNPAFSVLGMVNMMDDDTEEEVTNYYFVSNKKVAKAIEYTHDEYGDIEDTVAEIEGKRFFYVSKKTIHMARGSNIKDKYLVFPQLADVFRRLVDLYLQYPDYSDEERFGKIIEETKGRKFINKY